MVDHAVTIEPGSRLAALGLERPIGHSVHHQSIDRVGDGLVVTARADDGTVEGVELPNRWVVGVQWHPEDTAAADPEQQAIFDAFVGECARRRVVRGVVWYVSRWPSLYDRPRLCAPVTGSCISADISVEAGWFLRQAGRSGSPLGGENARCRCHRLEFRYRPSHCSSFRRVGVTASSPRCETPAGEMTSTGRRRPPTSRSHVRELEVALWRAAATGAIPPSKRKGH